MSWCMPRVLATGMLLANYNKIIGIERNLSAGGNGRQRAEQSTVTNKRRKHYYPTEKIMADDSDCRGRGLHHDRPVGGEEYS